MRCLLILVGPSHRTAEQRGTRMPPAAPPPTPPVALTPAKHTPANTMDIAQPRCSLDSRFLRSSPNAPDSESHPATRRPVSATLAEGRPLLISEPARLDSVTTIGADKNTWHNCLW